jgi:hypothetical protein
MSMIAEKENKKKTKCTVKARFGIKRKLESIEKLWKE